MGIAIYWYNKEAVTRTVEIMHITCLKQTSYLELRHRRSEYDAPPPQVREHSLHDPQASHSVSLSSSDRAVRELCKTQEETGQEVSCLFDQSLMV